MNATQEEISYAAALFNLPDDKVTQANIDALRYHLETRKRVERQRAMLVDHIAFFESVHPHMSGVIK